MAENDCQWGDQWGEQLWGNCLPEVALIPVAVQPGVQPEPRFQRAIDFPLRFTLDGNVVLTVDEDVIYDNILLSVFVHENGIPLVPLGFGADQHLFEPTDIVSRASMAIGIQQAVSLGVADVKVDVNNITFREDGDKTQIAVTYFHQRIREIRETLLSVDKVRLDR